MSEAKSEWADEYPEDRHYLESIHANDELLREGYTRFEVVYTASGRKRPDMEELFHLDLRDPETVETLEYKFPFQDKLGINFHTDDSNPRIERQALLQYLIEDGINKGDFRNVDKLITMADQPVESDPYSYAIYCTLRALGDQQKPEGVFDAYGISHNARYFYNQAASKGHWFTLRHFIDQLNFTETQSVLGKKAKIEMFREGMETINQCSWETPFEMTGNEKDRLKWGWDNNFAGINQSFEGWQDFVKNTVFNNDLDFEQPVVGLIPNGESEIARTRLTNDQIDQLLDALEMIRAISSRRFRLLFNRKNILEEQDYASYTVFLPGMCTVKIEFLKEDGRPIVVWDIFHMATRLNSYVRWLDVYEDGVGAEIAPLIEQLTKAKEKRPPSRLEKDVRDMGRFMDATQYFNDLY